MSEKHTFWGSAFFAEMLVFSYTKHANHSTVVIHILHEDIEPNLPYVQSYHK